MKLCKKLVIIIQFSVMLVMILLSCNLRYQNNSEKEIDGMVLVRANKAYQMGIKNCAYKGTPSKYHNPFNSVELPPFIKRDKNGGRYDEMPIHKVYLDDFYIDKYEVTNKQYCMFLNEKGNQIEDEKLWLDIESKDCQIITKDGIFVPKEGYENHPVGEVTWWGARAFANWAGKRLQSEAEWEFAAKGGRKSKKYKYSGSNDIDDVADYSDRNDPTTAVGLNKPNELGIYDMSGNVNEWCADWYSQDYYKNSPYKNPRGPASGIYRIHRGGHQKVH